MTRNLKVAFFGTSDRAIPILESLNKNFELVLCVTKHDTKIGRHQITKPTGVKKWALKNHIEVLELENFKGPEINRVLQKLTKKCIDYGVVADFSLIVPKPVVEEWYGRLINIHFSLLPKYRGASPIQFALLEGNNLTGITYQLLDVGLDTGAILHQIEYPIGSKSTSGDLYEKLFALSAQNLAWVLGKYARNEIVPKPQNENRASYTYSKSHPNTTLVYKEDAYINWNYPLQKIENMIRAFNPWPIAWTTLKELENSSVLKKKGLSLKKHVNSALTMKIYETDLIAGELKLRKIQVEGKKQMDWKSFENGYLELTR